jgi:hypothetical protein
MACGIAALLRRICFIHGLIAFSAVKVTLAARVFREPVMIILL